MFTHTRRFARVLGPGVPHALGRAGARSSVVPALGQPLTSSEIMAQIEAGIHPLSDTTLYHTIADATLDTICDGFDELEHQASQLASDSESVSCVAEYSAGVIDALLKPGPLHYVINKQEPNRQIWLSSPFSGPQRYSWDPTTRLWRHTRTGTDLMEVLRQELLKWQPHLGAVLAFGPRKP